MDPKFKVFRNSIHKIHFSIAGIFLFSFVLTLYFLSALLYIFILVGLGLCIGMLIWEISKFKQKRLPFKQDRRTNALTFTALTTSVVSFTLLGSAVVIRVFECFSYNFAIPLLLGLVVFIVAAIMLEDFLPEQVVAEYIVEPQAEIP